MIPKRHSPKIAISLNDNTRILFILKGKICRRLDQAAAGRFRGGGRIRAANELVANRLTESGRDVVSSADRTARPADRTVRSTDSGATA